MAYNSNNDNEICSENIYILGYNLNILIEYHDYCALRYS